MSHRSHLNHHINETLQFILCPLFLVLASLHKHLEVYLPTVDSLPLSFYLPKIRVGSILSISVDVLCVACKLGCLFEQALGVVFHPHFLYSFFMSSIVNRLCLSTYTVTFNTLYLEGKITRRKRRKSYYSRRF